MLERAIRAARLDVELYETVEADEGYTGEAAVIVIVANLLASIGDWLGPSRGFFSTVIGGVIGAVVAWLIWSGVALFIGTRLFDGSSNYGEMLRALGFAQAPLAIGLIPFLGWIGAIWALVAGVVAIRQAMDFTTGKAVGTVLVGWLAVLALIFVRNLVF